MTRFCEENQICAGIDPYDMGAAAGTGDWVSLKNHHHVVILFYADAGQAGDDPTITVQQASDVSGTGAKALNFTDIYEKEGTLTSVGQFTKQTQTAANTYTSATGGESGQIIAIEFDASDLDVDNDFDCIRATIADVGSGALKYGALLYLLTESRIKKEAMPSAIAE